MEFVVTICFIIIAITCLSIDGKLRKTIQQNEKVIELLNKGKDK